MSHEPHMPFSPTHTTQTHTHSLTHTHPTAVSMQTQDTCVGPDVSLQSSEHAVSAWTPCPSAAGGTPW